MRSVNTSQVVAIPENVEVKVDARVVNVKGPRGTLTRSFKHVNIEIMTLSPTKLRLQVWFGDKKHVACIRSCASHIQNMIKGVTKGFQYKMKSAYAHFPININIADDKRSMEIRNFLGERVVRRIPMLEGVTVAPGTKDEIVLTGNSIDNVSQTAATIQQSTSVKNKDIRKFLDGCYVSERGVIKGKNE